MVKELSVSKTAKVLVKPCKTKTERGDDEVF
jgi:hypothetical protein